MVNFTKEESRVILFVLGLAFCGLVLNNLVKASCHIKKLVYPQVRLAKINLNQASLQELIELKCISAKLAQSIIEYRDARNEFSSLEELKEIKGIGNYRYEKLKDIFFVE